jgi:hypothetical protein
VEGTGFEGDSRVEARGSRSGGEGVCAHKHDVKKRFDVLDIQNVRKHN